MLGDFENGWPEHEWRWQDEQLRHAQRRFAQPIWLGKENIAGTRARHWRQILGKATRPRIGLAWSGRLEHRNDRNRSIALTALLQIVSPSADFVSLQKDVRPSDRAALAERPELIGVSDGLSDFADTAALLEELDLVITVDTSVAHLAGALRKPVWILFPFVADWRWLRNRDDSPWYTSARLFRQPAIGDWATVINRVREALQSSYYQSDHRAYS